jgi:hypothetical protein
MTQNIETKNEEKMEKWTVTIMLDSGVRASKTVSALTPGEALINYATHATAIKDRGINSGEVKSVYISRCLKR